MNEGPFQWMQLYIQGQCAASTNCMEDTGPIPEQSEFESSNKSREEIKTSVSWFLKHSYEQYAATANLHAGTKAYTIQLEAYTNTHPNYYCN